MRYEHAGKFWSITRVGSVVTIVSGKIGNKGRTFVKHHPNEGAAVSAHDGLVLEKQREGYRIAAADAPAAMAPEAPADDDRGAALEAAIASDPEDAQAFAVYGDWLQKHGDPRGELIALQNATGPKAAAAVGKHLAQHAPRLLGSLAQLVRDVRDPHAAHASNFPKLGELWLPYTYVNPGVEKLLAPVAKRVIPDSKGPIDTLDYDLAGEAVPGGEDRYGGIRE